MKKLTLLTLAFVFLFTACAPATPTPEPIDVEATIAAAAQAMLEGTLTAMPTATLPPTETPTPTFTPEPSQTPTATFTATATITNTPEPFTGSLSSGDLSNLPHGDILILNETEDAAIITFQGVTSPGERAVYYSWRVEKGQRFVTRIPWGSYDIFVNISDKKIHTSRVRIYNYDKTTFVIRMDKFLVQGP